MWGEGGGGEELRSAYFCRRYIYEVLGIYNPTAEQEDAEDYIFRGDCSDMVEHVVAGVGSIPAVRVPSRCLRPPAPALNDPLYHVYERASVRASEQSEARKVVLRNLKKAMPLPPQMIGLTNVLPP